MAARKNKNGKGKGRRIWGIILTVYGSMLLFNSLILLCESRGDVKAVSPFLVILGVVFLTTGILLIKSASDADPYAKWKTTDPSEEAGLIRKIRKIRNDGKLLEIGKQAGLESVAGEAFGRISDQTVLGNYVSSNVGVNKRLETALSVITDQRVLADVVMSKHFLSTDLRKQAIRQITDAGRLKSLAESRERIISRDLRTEIYHRLFDVTKKQGEDVCNVDLMLARDREMPLDMREKSYANLESAGKNGDRLLAEDESMSPKQRLEAYERIGDHENAEKISRIIDQTDLLCITRSLLYRKAAASRILETGDEDWIETNVRKALAQSDKTDKVLKDFFVEASKQYPGIIKKMWPQISRFAHSDSIRHDDGHNDSAHQDSISDGTQGYRRGQHIDYQNSDCSHSDSHNTNIHTDNTDKDFLCEFPPAVRD